MPHSRSVNISFAEKRDRRSDYETTLRGREVTLSFDAPAFIGSKHMNRSVSVADHFAFDFPPRPFGIIDLHDGRARSGDVPVRGWFRLRYC
jgi:hypothetical protein